MKDNFYTYNNNENNKLVKSVETYYVLSSFIARYHRTLVEITNVTNAISSMGMKLADNSALEFAIEQALFEKLGIPADIKSEGIRDLLVVIDQKNFALNV